MSNTPPCWAKHIDSSMPDSRLRRTLASVCFIFWLTADSCSPASARRIGTPARSKVCNWRLNSIRSAGSTRGANQPGRPGAWPAAALAGAAAPPRWAVICSGVTPRDCSSAATALASAPSSSPLTAPLAARPV